MKLALYALSIVYRSITDLRNYFFDRGIFKRYASSLPVLSVGNITAGGNGKTPLVLSLCELLESHQPVVLLRGYGGSLCGPHLVSSKDDPLKVGDEALLYKRTVDAPVVISRRRVAGAKFIEKQGLGKLIILDDGLQHRWLQRDFEIVSIDVGSKTKFEDLTHERMLPIGLCRERPSSALKRANLIVCADRGRRVDFEAAKKSIQSTFAPLCMMTHARFVLQSVQSLRDASTISSRKIAAFCALANPDNFFMMLKEQGYELLGTETFNDHHQFNEGDIHRLRKRFPEVPLVCTEKDATKLNTAWDAMLYVAAGSVSLGDEQKIAAAIETIIESKSNR